MKIQNNGKDPRILKAKNKVGMIILRLAPGEIKEIPKEAYDAFKQNPATKRLFELGVLGEPKEPKAPAPAPKAKPKKDDFSLEV